jgi:hypothetical protein
MITLFKNTLIKSKEFGKIEFTCPDLFNYIFPSKISIISVVDKDRDCWAYTNIDVVNVMIGEKSQFYYNDGKENQEHRANSVFFKDLDISDWSAIKQDKSLVIEMFNYGFDDVRVNVCLWCKE